MEREKADHAIATMCRVLGVSTSGYHAWRQRPLSQRAGADAALSARIAEIHMHSRWTYGSPRIHAELQEEGVRCSRKRVARLKAGIEGCQRRRSIRTTQRAAEAEEVPDLVQRNFKPEAPWAWLHKLHRAIVIPGRDLLHGEVEVDETCVGGEEPG